MYTIHKKRKDKLLLPSSEDYLIKDITFTKISYNTYDKNIFYDKKNDKKLFYNSLNPDVLCTQRGFK